MDALRSTYASYRLAYAKLVLELDRRARYNAAAEQLLLGALQTLDNMREGEYGSGPSLLLLSGAVTVWSVTGPVASSAQCTTPTCFFRPLYGKLCSQATPLPPVSYFACPAVCAQLPPWWRAGRPWERLPEHLTPWAFRLSGFRRRVVPNMLRVLRAERFPGTVGVIRPVNVCVCGVLISRHTSSGSLRGTSHPGLLRDADY